MEVSYWNPLFMLDFVSIHMDYSMIRLLMITCVFWIHKVMLIQQFDYLRIY